MRTLPISSPLLLRYPLRYYHHPSRLFSTSSALFMNCVSPLFLRLFCHLRRRCYLPLLLLLVLCLSCPFQPTLAHGRDCSSRSTLFPPSLSLSPSIQCLSYFHFLSLLLLLIPHFFSHKNPPPMNPSQSSALLLALSSVALSYSTGCCTLPATYSYSRILLFLFLLLILLPFFLSLLLSRLLLLLLHLLHSLTFFSPSTFSCSSCSSYSSYSCGSCTL